MEEDTLPGGENMKFTVVDVGYDRNQVDSCLADLGSRLAWLTVRAEVATDTGAELTVVRAELTRLRDLLGYGSRSPAEGRGDGPRQPSGGVRDEAAELLDRARVELAAAREEARLVRDRAYAEALQARRDFEAALHARRIREERMDQLLRSATVAAPAAANNPAVPVTRGASADSSVRVDGRDTSLQSGRQGGPPSGVDAT